MGVFVRIDTGGALDDASRGSLRFVGTIVAGRSVSRRSRSGASPPERRIQRVEKGRCIEGDLWAGAVGSASSTVTLGRGSWDGFASYGAANAHLMRDTVSLLSDPATKYSRSSTDAKAGRVALERLT